MASVDYSELAELCAFPVDVDSRSAFERNYIYCFAKCVESGCRLLAQTRNDCLGCFLSSLTPPHHSCMDCTRMDIIYRYFCEVTDNVQPEAVKDLLNRINIVHNPDSSPNPAQLFFGCQTVLRPAVF